MDKALHNSQLPELQDLIRFTKNKTSDIEQHIMNQDFSQLLQSTHAIVLMSMWVYVSVWVCVHTKKVVVMLTNAHLQSFCGHTCNLPKNQHTLLEVTDSSPNVASSQLISIDPFLRVGAVPSFHMHKCSQTRTRTRTRLLSLASSVCGCVVL